MNDYNEELMQNEAASAKSKKKKFKIGTYTLAATVVVVIIAVIINLVVYTIPDKFKNIDLTASSLYTLSADTKEMLKTLDRDVTVYWIVQKGEEESTMEKLLDNFAYESDHIIVEKIDPILNPNFAKQYTESETAYDNSLIVVDKSTGENVFLSTGTLYEYRYDEAYNYVAEFGGEAYLAAAIQDVLIGESMQLYFTTGHGEALFTDTMSGYFEQNSIYAKDVSLFNMPAVPDDCDVLIINGPTQDITEDEYNKIENYIHNGGSLILFTDYQNDGLKRIYSIAEEYGFVPDKGMILEADDYYFSSFDTTTSKYNMFAMPVMYPHDITAQIIGSTYKLVLPYAQAIGLTEGLTTREDVKFDVILSSSKEARLVPADENGELDTSSVYTTESGFPLAVVAIKKNDMNDESKDSSFAWIGSRYMNIDQIDAAVNGANSKFMINTIKWACDKEVVAATAGKTSVSGMLNIKSATITLWSIVFIAVIPLIFIVIGIIIWAKRRTL